MLYGVTAGAVAGSKGTKTMNASKIANAGNEVAALAVQNDATNIADVIRKAITDHEAAAAGPAATDLILAWTTGLGVAFKNGQALPCAVSLLAATKLEPKAAAMFEVVNGNREAAQPTMRATAIRGYLTTLRQLAADMEAAGL